MRVVDSLFFALAFLVDYIVCPGNLNPDPPYRVVKMTPEQIPGVMIVYPTKYRKFFTRRTVHKINEYHPVQDDIYAVIEGAIIDHQTGTIQGGRIIGHTDDSHKLHGISGLFENGREIISYRLGGSVSNPQERMQKLSIGAINELGLFKELPGNTIYQDNPQPYTRRFIYKDAKHLTRH